MVIFISYKFRILVEIFSMTDKLKQGDRIRLSIDGMSQNRWRQLSKLRMSGVKDVNSWLSEHNDRFPDVLQKVKLGETAIITKVMYRNTKMMSVNIIFDDGLEYMVKFDEISEKVNV